MRLMVDTDAWHCLHKFGLTDALLGQTTAAVLMGEYACRHELASLQVGLQLAEQQGRLGVHGVKAADRLYRELQRTVDKGEAEAIAWLVAHGLERDVFVSNDVAARKCAAGHRLRTWDAFDAMVWLIDMGAVDAEALRKQLIPWDDSPGAFCRPKGYAGFEQTAALRRKGRDG